MTLEIQIQSLLTSFVYGLFLSFTFNILYKYLYHNKKILRIVIDILYTLTFTIIYFSILIMINNGIVHPYFLIMLIMGFITGNKKTKNIRTVPKIKVDIKEKIW